MTRRTMLLAILGLAVAPRVASARGFGVRLRMVGYVSPPPERPELANLLLRAGKQDVPFQVTKGTMLSGRGLISDVFDSVAPYKPSFTVRGPSDLVDKVSNAPMGAHLVIIGAWIPPSRDFLLASVEPEDQAR